MGPDAAEPKYDRFIGKCSRGFYEFKSDLDQDKARCWKTLKTVPGSAGTATSGLCNGKCFVSAYKYKIVTKNNTEFNWFVQRGCAANPHIRKAPQKSGTVPTERKRLILFWLWANIPADKAL